MKQVSFRLVLEKADQEGRCPVFLDFHYKGERLRYFTQEKCRPEQWDADKMRFRRSLPGYRQANDSLDRLAEKVLAAYRRALDAGRVPTPEELRETLAPKPVEKLPSTLPELFTVFMAYKQPTIKKSTLKEIGTVRGRLRDFEYKYGKLRLNEYTRQTHERFTRYQLQERGLHPNSVGHSDRVLLSFFRYCVEVLKLPLSPDHPKIKKRSVPTQRIFLNVGELDKLRTAQLPASLERVRDAFLFACLTGLRYSDLRHLKPEQISQREGYRVIVLLPEKSRSQVRNFKTIEVPLLPEAEELLARYAGNFRALPVVSNQKMNEMLKEMGERAGLTEPVQIIRYRNGLPTASFVPKWKLITTHVARHTFATVALIKGVPLEIVQEVMGHSDMKTTRVYAKVVNEFKNRVLLSALSA